MRSRRLISCVLLTIALAASAFAQSPATSTEPQGPTLAQAEEQVRAIRATLKNPSTPPQTWGVLMMSEMVLLRLRAQKAAGGGPIDEAALSRCNRPSSVATMLGGKVETWRALDEAYQLAGWDERRAAHLAAWIKSPLAAPAGEQLIWLADFRAGHDGPQAGLDTLRLAWGKTHDSAVASELADLLLETGKMNDFTALEGARGLPRDVKKAAYWWRKALAFNDDEARGWLIAHHLLE